MYSELKFIFAYISLISLFIFQIHEIMSYIQKENMTEDSIQKRYCYMSTSAVATGNIRL